jgi:DNA-binding MarR family transcriptional regulator
MKKADEGRSMTDTTAGRAFALNQSPSHLLHRAQQLAAEWFTRTTPSDAVTLRQFAVLAAIAEKPGQSQTDLVRATGVDRSTLADMIARMEKRGWITRKTAARDARAKSVSLSAAGRKMLDKATPSALAADAALMALLPKTRQGTFLRTLETLAQAAEALAAAEPEGQPQKAKKEAPAKAVKRVKAGPEKEKDKTKSKVKSKAKAKAKAKVKKAGK